MHARTGILAAVIATSAAISAISLLPRMVDSATGETETGAALDRFDPPPATDRVAALVNGQPIKLRDVELLVAASEAAGNPVSRADALDGFIDNELWLQAATRAGLGPSEAEVARALAEVKALTSEESLAVVIGLNARAGNAYDSAEAYWADPQRAVAMTRDLAVKAILDRLTSAIADPAERDRVVSEQLATLRSEAEIEILDP